MKSPDFRIQGQGFECPWSQDWDNVHRAKKHLTSDPGCGVRIKCFNEANVAEYKTKFTEEELKRIQFTWLTFPKS